MANVLLNGSSFPGAEHTASWGPLLEAIDRHVAATGEIVSAVRFDGIDEPGFREAAVLVRPLASDAIVEVETQTPEALLDQVIDEGVASLAQLQSATLTLAAGFRSVDVRPAADGLVQLSEGLISLLALVIAAASASGTALDTLQVAGAPVAPVMRTLDGAVTSLLDAHAAHDWIAVADILEYDVAPALPPFEGVLEALRPR